MAQPLTRDDSLAEEMVAQGLLSEADAMESPHAHVVTRWIGIGARDAEPHVAQFSPPGPGALLLCSDGLWNYDPDGGELAALALPAALDNPRAAATALLLFALEAGGIDNITAALVPHPIAGPDPQAAGQLKLTVTCRNPGDRSMPAGLDCVFCCASDRHRRPPRCAGPRGWVAL